MVSGSRAKANRRAARGAAERVAAAEQRVERERSLFNSHSFMQKLARADHHIANLDAAIATWAVDGYRVSEQTDAQGIVTMYAQLLRPLPESLPLLIGDAAQCIFNALDHLAFAVASINPQGLTETDENNSAFPIRSSAARNNTGMITPDVRIAKWPPCAAAIANVMQPYLGSQGLNRHPVWMLRDLANRDKHRRVTAAAVSHVIHELSMGNGYVDYLQTFGREEIGAEPVPLIAFSRRNYGDIKLVQSLAICFRPGPLVAGREVVPTLRELREYVERIPVDKLRRFT